MKIVFWSPTAGSGNVSSTTALCATYASLKYQLDCSIVPLNVGNRGAQNAFMNADADESLNKVLGGFGVDALLLSIAGGFMSADDVKNVALSVLSKLSYFTVSKDSRVATAQEIIYNNYTALMETLERAFDYQFIDIGSGTTDVTEQAIGDADVVVICLQQNKDTVDTLFESVDISELPCMYLLTDYDPALKFNVKNFAKGKPFCKGSIAAMIPHNAAFGNALNDSQLLGFVAKGANTNKASLLQKLGIVKREADQFFFNSVDNVVNKIFKLGGATDELL